MKIQNVSRLNAGLILLFFLLLVFSSFRTLQIQDDIRETDRRRLLAVQIADELRHRTDEQARLARSYVVTGDPAFKQRFSEALATPPGLPGTHDQAPGEPLAPAELALLAEARQGADALLKIEARAFTLLETRQNDEATRLLHDADYHRAVDATVAPLTRLNAAIASRTEAEMEALASDLRQMVVLSLGLALAGFGGFFLMVGNTHRRLLKPVLKLLEQTKQIRHGNYSVRVNEADFVGDLAPLGHAFNRMADAVSDEIAAREIAAGQLSESERFSKATLDSLSAHLCVIDETGKILSVNAAWRRFASENGTDPDTVSEGSNYINLCHGSCGDWSEEAHPFVEGLLALISGSRDYFALEYPCHSPTEKRWFQARATRFPGNGPMRIVVVHENITALKLAEEAAVQSETRLAGIIETAMDAIVSIDGKHCVTLFNPAAEAMFGYRREEVLGQPLELLLPERFRSGHHERIDSFAHSQQMRRYVGEAGRILGRRKSGEEFKAEATLSRFTHRNEIVFTVFLRDVTERVRNEEQLRLWATVMASGHEGIIITDAEQRILATNPAFSAITGYSEAEALGQTPRLLASGRHPRRFYEDMNHQLQLFGYWQGEIWNRRKNGEAYPEWLSISAVRAPDAHLTHYIGIFSDIGAHKAAEDRIRFLSYHDALTGLPKRELLHDRAEQAIVHAAHAGECVALLFIDLDRFKTINDSLGHAVGDRLLRMVADRIRACIPEEATLSRHSGDEFVVLLPELKAVDATAGTLQGIVERFNDAFVISEQPVSISLSIGVSVYPADTQDFDGLLQKAESAMYAAKDDGRNTYRYFTDKLNSDASERLRVQTRLHDALAEHEFVLHYQPQIDLASGQVIGVEALIRWNDGQSGLIPPGRFIPVAEDTGMIIPIGNWVLGEACRQACAWQKAGLGELTMAVNLSALQFKRGDIEAQVSQALLDSGLEPQYLELEITESIMIHEPELILATLTRLKAIGVKLSIDDFGTGYSSLSYLRDFSVDKLKIDQSFVRDLVDNPDNAAIVNAIVQMARSLKMRTIAEGVESAEVLNRLKLFHCDEIQGFYFSRPLPAAECADYLREHLPA